MQKQKIRLIVIAGPQSSGKTTSLNLLKQKYPNFNYLEEINPYNITNNNHQGAAFVNKNMQINIANIDIRRTKNILVDQLSHDRGNNGKTNNAYIIETGIFGLVYFERLMEIKNTDIYYKKYLSIYKKFDPIIIFIDTKPTISWKRRKPIYLKRIKDNGIIAPSDKKAALKKYRQIIYDLYPLWLKYYNKVPFDKYMIKNSNKSYSRFKQELINKIQFLT